MKHQLVFLEEFHLSTLVDPVLYLPQSVILCRRHLRNEMVQILDCEIHTVAENIALNAKNDIVHSTHMINT